MYVSEKLLVLSMSLVCLTACGQDRRAELADSLASDGMPKALAVCAADALIEADFPSHVYKSIIEGEAPAMEYKMQVADIVVESMLSC